MGQRTKESFTDMIGFNSESQSTVNSLDIFKLKEFFKNQPVIKAWLFGSYSRGEQTPDSDVDLLVEFDKDNFPSLFKMGGMLIDLEELLEKKVDLVEKNMLFPSVIPYVEKEKILIYERGA